MKKLDEVMEIIRYGSILTINKDNGNNEIYNGCMIIYDGNIFVDVKVIDLGNFIDEVPNIKSLLDSGYSYKIKYLYEKEKYQSTIMRKIKEGGYDEPPVEEVVSDFKVLSDDFFDSIIGLDTKIAQSNTKHDKNNNIILKKG